MATDKEAKETMSDLAWKAFCVMLLLGAIVLVMSGASTIGDVLAEKVAAEATAMYIAPIDATPLGGWGWEVDAAWPHGDLIINRSIIMKVDVSGLDELMDALPAPSGDRLDLILDVSWHDETLFRMHRSGEIIIDGEQVAFDPEGCERVWRVMTVALESYGYDKGRIAEGTAQ